MDEIKKRIEEGRTTLGIEFGSTRVKAVLVEDVYKRQESGWDPVLKEAKDADIPVIIVDRMVDVSDDSLYTAWVGSDFKLEGEKDVYKRQAAPCRKQDQCSHHWLDIKLCYQKSIESST